MKKIKLEWIPLFAILFPVIPGYFVVGGVAVVNILCVVTAFYFLLRTRLNVMSLKVSSFGLAIIIFVFVRMMVNAIHGALTAHIYWVFYIIACAAITQYAKTRECFDKVIEAVIWSGAFMGLFGVIESVTHFNIFLLINTAGYTLNYNQPRFGLTRVLLFTGHTIEYGLYCMFVLSFVFYRIVNCMRKQDKRRYMIIYALVFLSAVLTLSRSSLFCLILCQLILLYISGFTNFLKTMIKIVAVGTATMTVLAIAVPTVAQILSYVWLMFLAVFSESTQLTISSAFGNDNIGGWGNRMDLFKWVIEDLRGRYIFGAGINETFQHSYKRIYGIYSIDAVKSSIEVNYLSILWRYGLVDLAIELFLYIGSMLKGFRFRPNEKYGEYRLSFGKMFSVSVFCYLIAWFAVAQGNEMKIFFVMAALFIAYCKGIKQTRRDLA